LLLETTLDFNEDIVKAGDWRVVDIDQWLEGNEFLAPPDLSVVDDDTEKEKDS